MHLGWWSNDFFYDLQCISYFILKNFSIFFNDICARLFFLLKIYVILLWSISFTFAHHSQLHTLWIFIECMCVCEFECAESIHFATDNTREIFAMKWNYCQRSGVAPLVFAPFSAILSTMCECGQFRVYFSFIFSTLWILVRFVTRKIFDSAK